MDRVTIYASLGLRPGISELLWAFRKKHTLEEFPVYLDDHPFQVHNRITEELKHGMRTADIVLLPHYMTMQFKSEGLLAPTHPKSLAAYPAHCYDKEKHWFAAGITFMTMAYHSKRLKPRELPKSLDELTEPRWKNMLGMQSLTSSKVGNIGAHYMAFLRKKAGNRKWTALLESLAGPNRPRTYDCIDHLIQGMLDGNHSLALTVYSLAYLRERGEGSPIADFETSEMPHMLTFASMALLKTSSNNDSARRFIDFMLSEDAQRIIGGIAGLFPVRPGVKSGQPIEIHPTSKDEFYPTEDELESMPKVMEVLRSLNVP